MELWTAFLLGLVGSLHCAGMCGPIALALQGNAPSQAEFLLGRLLYNGGRIITYCAIGAVFGGIGQTFTLIGLGRWVTISAGVLILLTLVLGMKISLGARIARPVNLLKNQFGKLLRSKSPAAIFGLGLLNGILPCGLVYAAAAGAASSANLISGMLYMIAFGFGTVPMMLAISLLGKKLQFGLRLKLQNLIPITLVSVAVLLIFRGLELGIPFLSPDFSAGGCCKH